MYTIIIVTLTIIIIAIVMAWIVTSSKKEKEVRSLIGQVAERDADLIRKEAEVEKANALLDSEIQRHKEAIDEIKKTHENALSALKEGQKNAIDAAKTTLALENEKNLKKREQELRDKATEAMKIITDDLNHSIVKMKESFEAQKVSHTAETSSIKTQFEDTVKHLKEQTEAIGNQAEDLARALKGKNKLQGNFGETILANMLIEQGFREGFDYESEYWLRDKNGNRIRNEGTGKHMRPDFVLHLPDETDILVDSKMSLTALTDYYAAETDEDREDAATRNLESVKNHVKELTSKEYQKYIVGRKTLDFVIMFIPNYGAWQLAKMKDSGLFNWALEHNVLVTTEETLVPFLRLIHSAWMQKEQMENIEEIVKAAEDMVKRVGIFCKYNSDLEDRLEKIVEEFHKNSTRLIDGDQSIVKAAMRAIKHGVTAPTGKNALPEVNQLLLTED